MEYPVRVLHFVRKMSYGGIETYIMNLYRNINRNKIQFDFLVNDEGTFDEEIKTLGGKIYNLPHLGTVNAHTYTKNLDNFFKEHKEYQIVHSHYGQVTGIILEVAKKNNVKIRIAHSHSIKIPKVNILVTLYKRYLQTKILRNSNLLLSCSEEASKFLYKKKYKDAIILKNGISTERFIFNNGYRTLLRKDLKIDEKTTVIGNVGRFEHPKNHSFLIDIFYEYQLKNKDSKLILFGVGTLLDIIKNKVKELGIEDKVIFMGAIKEVNRFYSVMDIFLFPSIHEGLGIALVEAQTNGLPCYASDSIPKEANPTGRVKFISLKENSKCWANILLNAKNKRYDALNKIILEGYDIKDVANKLQKIYLKNINKKK